MTKSKYKHLFFTEPVVEGNFAPQIGLKGLPGLNIRIAHNCYTGPYSIKEVHKHEHDQYLCFIGGNPLDITDFGADVEL